MGWGRNPRLFQAAKKRLISGNRNHATFARDNNLHLIMAADSFFGIRRIAAGIVNFAEELVADELLPKGELRGFFLEEIVHVLFF